MLFRQRTVRTMCVAVALLFSAHAFAVSAKLDERHARDLQSNPIGLRFLLQITSGKRVFHRGEPVALTLSFSSDLPDKYKLDTAGYDRSGRLPTEEFVMEPDAVDPYADFFGVPVLGGIAGGLRTNPVLGRDPVKVELRMNDWFRFDRPGTYRFYLKSHRLSREALPGESEQRTVQFAAVSNIVEIEILPEDPVWELSRITALRQIVDHVAPAAPDGPNVVAIPGRPDEELREAWKELRALGTNAAVELALDLFERLDSAADSLLLVGSRDRAATIAAYDRHLARPNVAIYEWDIRLRAFLAYIEKERPRRLPILVWQLPGEQEMAKLQRTAATYQANFRSYVREQALRLIPAVQAKQGKARKISSAAIATLAPEAARAARLVQPDDYGLTRQQLIERFSSFDEDQQAELLGKKWDLVRGPAMIPVLRDLIAAHAPVSRPGTHHMSHEVWGAEGGLAITALQRLADLSPGEVLRVVMQDISSLKPRLTGFAVRELPAQSLPELDGALRSLLETDYDAAMPLVAKFGSANLLDTVRKHYLSDHLPCTEDQSAVTYMVRVAPEEDGLGRELLHKAMANREECGWYRFLLPRLAATAWNPAVRAEVLAALNDPDPEVAAGAASALAAHGPADLEPALWRRLEKWSREWRGRIAELNGPPLTGDGNKQQQRLGEALFTSITTAQAWLYDEPRRERLLAFCIDDYCRKRWSYLPTSGPMNIEVSGGGAIYPTRYRIFPYTCDTLDDLKRKLQQFPAGTDFLWPPHDGNPFDTVSPGRRDDLFKELQAFLARHSMTISVQNREPQTIAEPRP